MPARRSLISGASIAGPALAFWLARYGWETTLVERAPALREGGQNIDIRGAGREVARRMGLEDAVRAATTGEQGTRFVDSRGGTVATFPAGTSDTDGATAELEILRGDLARLLVAHTSSGTEYVYGDRITALDQSPDDVTVTFEHGDPRAFDIVIAADGMRSTTRPLAFGDGATIRQLGMSTAYFTIPRIPTDDPWWRWYNVVGGRSITLRPDNVGTTRAALSVLTASTGVEFEGRDAQQAMLRETFRGAGWQADRVLEAMTDAHDFYFESIGQVTAPRWSNGRVALVGDAAYCASPVSGMGTSLALVGAYVLAGELASHVDHRDAFRGYERIMRPYVSQAQKLPPGVPAIANPRTAAGIAAFHAVLRVASSRVVTGLGGRIFSPPADAIELPHYSHLER